MNLIATSVRAATAALCASLVFTVLLTALPPAARAEQTLPFTSTLNNGWPIALGMSPEETSAALGAPLYYVQGPPGNEMLMAFRGLGGQSFLPRQDRLYLQYRKGRLTGWKGDWGRNWMWQ